VLQQVKALQLHVWSMSKTKFGLEVTVPRTIPQSGVCARVQNKLIFPVTQLRLAKTVLP